MKKTEPNTTYVFRRIRPTSNRCPACHKQMACLIKNANLTYICDNPECTLKSDVNNLKKSGWQIHKTTK